VEAETCSPHPPPPAPRWATRVGSVVATDPLSGFCYGQYIIYTYIQPGAPPAAGLAQVTVPATALPSLRIPTGKHSYRYKRGEQAGNKRSRTGKTKHPFPPTHHKHTQGNPHNPALPALIQALPDFPNLEALALEYRNVRCEDCLALAAIVASGRACGRLRSLNVSCNFLRKASGVCSVKEGVK
jgi:hypothetical protein